MPYCCVCNHTVDHWVPHPLRAQRSPLMVMLDTVGSDLSVYGCPSCNANDRDRHLWLYMKASGVVGSLEGANILHMAPEWGLEPLIEACKPGSYVRGDLFPTHAHYQRVDLENLDFGNDSLDLVICNHVLEHVHHLEKALSEIFRCLKPGGLLIAQTPYAPVLKHTFEMKHIPDAATAKLLYGQEDHVRLFGGDIVDYFHAAGLQGDLLRHEALLPEVDAATFGCNAKEPFFVFWKPHAAAPVHEGVRDEADAALA